MHCHEFATRTPPVALFEVPGKSALPTSVVLDEPAWRALPLGCVMAAPDPRAIPTRWHAVAPGVQEQAAQTADDCHIVKIVLRNMNMRLAVAGRTVQDGVVTPGMFHVTASGAPVRCLFRGPYDVLHLHVPNDLIGECAQDMPGYPALSLLPEDGLAKDAMVERLGRALLDADEACGAFGSLYTDSIGTAIVARILGLAQRTGACERPKVAGLARWRLRRAIEYVESRLAEPISLGDVAAAAGLTRMHFAAQFRAATGLRPHEYLLRRRIERAQEMLAETAMPVVEVALSVGFQTQSHFTTVFKRFTGQPPHSWRRAHDEPSRPASRLM